MTEDWAADVRKYVPNPDENAIAGLIRYCGIALQNRDSSLVSFTDPTEIARVRENFLKKKLGLTLPDETLDEAIVAVGQRMKGDPTKNRVTVYYLLLEHFGLLHMFGGTSAGATAGTTAGVAGAVDGAAAGLAGATTAGAERAAAAAQPAYAYETPPPEEKSGGFGWWPWLLLALVALGLIWWLFLRAPTREVTPPLAPTNEVAPADEAVPANAMEPAANATGEAVGNVEDIASAPAEGTATIPTGSGVTVESRDGNPVAKVYFDTGKTDVAPAFAATAQGLRVFLVSHAGRTLTVSGFNDPTGNAAANAALSRNRAMAVKAALVAAGIPDRAVVLVKPANTTDTSTSLDSARRVEVAVH